MKKVLDSIKRRIKRNKFVIWIYSKTIGFKRNKNLKRNGLKILSKVDKAFRYGDLEYFLDFGTLLGFKRDGSFIQGDMDIDLGVFLKKNRDIRYEVKKIMLELGFKLYHQFIIENNVYEESYILDNVKVDFFYYDKNGDESFCYSFFREQKKDYGALNEFSVYKSTYLRLNKFVDISIEGFNFSIPENTEDILRQKYNDDWQVRNPNWNFDDANTIVKTNKIGYRIL